jgi:hypothetical protein
MRQLLAVLFLILPLAATTSGVRKQRKHRGRACADSTSHCQAHADRIFGRDSRQSDSTGPGLLRCPNLSFLALNDF